VQKYHDQFPLLNRLSVRIPSPLFSLDASRLSDHLDLVDQYVFYGKERTTYSLLNKASNGDRRGQSKERRFFQ
jgi:hypothetical protein